MRHVLYVTTTATAAIFPLKSWTKLQAAAVQLAAGLIN